MPAHKQADLMQQWADDAKETERPELRWQFRDAMGEWEDMQIGCCPVWGSYRFSYRRKPRTITVEVPVPRCLLKPEEIRSTVVIHETEEQASIFRQALREAMK